ncbi:MAG: hypothetical protein J6Y38_05985, partial [Bacteroidaceae bacterium]|nr:hypothetical protein [Bacteroidaceae bacterium]
FAPPAAQANLRSVFHDFKACATLRILHFYLELRFVQTRIYDLFSIICLMTLQGFPTAMEFEGMSRVTRSQGV